MSVSFKLQAPQAQTLTMTPQLVQSIRLLQMSSAELARHVMEEVEKNPLLELEERHGPEEPVLKAPDGDGEGSPVQVGDEFETSVAGMEEKLGTSLENAFDGDRSGGEQGSEWNGNGGAAATGGLSGSSGAGPELPDVQDYVAQAQSLRDHLIEQLSMERISEETRLLATAIIDHLDEDGYFRISRDEFLASSGATSGEFETALAAVQRLEPTGIGARDLAECLRLQLVERNRFDPAIGTLLDKLELLARRDFRTLQRLCETDLEDLMDMVDEIRSLDPRPARAFEHSPVQTVEPEVFVFERADGSFGIELNPDALPRVLVSQTYRAIVDRSRASDEEKFFVTECLQNANWLVRSLEQRAQTRPPAGDIVYDQRVDLIDLRYLCERWLDELAWPGCFEPADLDRDCRVDAVDFSILAGDWEGR